MSPGIVEIIINSFQNLESEFGVKEFEVKEEILNLPSKKATRMLDAKMLKCSIKAFLSELTFRINNCLSAYIQKGR